MNAIALPITIADIVDEYDAKVAAVNTEINALAAAFTRLEMAATVQGAYVGTVARAPLVDSYHMETNLLKSGWRACYLRLMIDHLATAKDKALFERQLEKPPALTVENVKGTFGDYLIRPRFHILRGLAEVFTSLDPAYKSHSNVRIGVKGLPKRIIIKGWGEFSSSYAENQFRDLVNALAGLRQQPRFSHEETLAIIIATELGEDAVLDGRTYESSHAQQHRVRRAKTINRGLTVRRFGNGNAHVIFDKWAMHDINRGLAEFYGEVLPDAEPENVKPSASTAVSKDLQFYWSPPDVVAKALDYAGLHTKEYWGRGGVPALYVLEPSCGDGRILDEIKARGYASLGIEYHHGRADQARRNNHSVLCRNFLECVGAEEFDRVVMNPPFYGKHYAKHVQHALTFLKPGGVLVAILPASARYDHGILKGEWQDLPVASFANVGTNIPTTMFKIVKRP